MSPVNLCRKMNKFPQVPFCANRFNCDTHEGRFSGSSGGQNRVFYGILKLCCKPNQCITGHPVDDPFIHNPGSQ